MTKKERQERALAKAAQQHSMPLEQVRSLIIGTVAETSAAAEQRGLTRKQLSAIRSSYNAAMAELAAAGQPAAPRRRTAPPSVCRHRIQRSSCPVCTPGLQRVVYVSAGGTRFHRTRDCAALLAGQQKVRDRDGVAATIQGVVRNAATLDQRDGCGTCFPAK